MTEDTTTTRRRLLGATGAAAVGLGAVVPAGASHFEYQEVVCVTVDVQAYDDARPNGTTGPIFEAGTRALDSCVDADEGEMVLFEPEPSYDQPFARVPAEFLESC